MHSVPSGIRARRRSRWPVALTMACLAWTSAACSDSPRRAEPASDASIADTTPGAAGTKVAEAAADKAAREVAAEIVSAGCTGFLKCGVLFGSTDACLAFWAGWELPDGLAVTVSATLRAGRGSVDPANVQACAARLSSRCRPNWAKALQQLCPELVGGNVALGGACRSTFECKSGLACDDGFPCPSTCKTKATLGMACKSDTECAPGTVCTANGCGAETPITAGDPCLPASASCSAGLACIASEKSGVCGPPKTSGQPCQTTFDCASALRCIEGICGAPSGLDSPCSKDNTGTPGSSGACAKGLVCVVQGGQGKCGTATPLGQVCTSSSACAAPAMGCLKDNQGGGRCLAGSPSGGPCDKSASPPQYCMSGLECDDASHRCAGLTSLGLPCPANGCGTDQTCDAGTCRGRRVEGEACLGAKAWCGLGLQCVGGSCALDCEGF